MKKRLSDCGLEVVTTILNEVKQKHIDLPREISLSILSEMTKCSPQSIGMAFNDYIVKPLRENGIDAKKRGTPVVIEIKKIE